MIPLLITAGFFFSGQPLKEPGLFYCKAAINY